jgi:hypothetical protein
MFSALSPDRVLLQEIEPQTMEATKGSIAV